MTEGGASRRAADGGDRPALSPGAKVGKYRIIRVLGKGGMGIVYEAKDRTLHRRVALKCLPDSSFMHPSARERLFREAQITARLSHPNIIAVYGAGQYEGQFFIAMELLLPMNVGGYLRKHGAIAWAEASFILADCCAALQAAHAAKVIHRDVKPDNILFTSLGVAKLADFGLLKELNTQEPCLTRSGVLLGTPLYMSPEQACGKPMDARSDLYSLGATYYALLTGQPPFSGDMPTLLFKHCHAEIPDPRQILAEIPESCARILMRATSKDPAQRYQSAAEMLADVEQVLSGVARPGLKFRDSLAISDTSRSSASFLPLTGVRAGHSQAVSRRVKLLVGFLLLALMAGGVGSWSFRGRRRSPSTSSPGEPLSAGMKVAPPIKVGILLSLTGGLASTERPVIDATLLAVEELNEQGGLLGRRLEAIVVDGQSETHNDGPFYRGALRLIEQEGVSVIFGGWNSASRIAIKGVVEKHDALLVYPSQSEGLEDSPNVQYMGLIPNQQALPAIDYIIGKLGWRRIFLLGVDGVYSRGIHAVIRDAMKAKGGQIVGEKYLTISMMKPQDAISQIQQRRPELVINTLRGDTGAAFMRALRDVGATGPRIPVLSFAHRDAGLGEMVPLNLEGDYLSAAYVSSIETPENRAFVDLVAKRLGKHIIPDEGMVAGYSGVHLWALAVKAAGSDGPRHVRSQLAKQRFLSPEGEISVDPSNLHVNAKCRVARIGTGNQLVIVQESAQPLSPIPFPGSRPRLEWEQFLDRMYREWGGHWVNPAFYRIPGPH